MYTTCLFCHANLGANEVVESFPVGRRLAFDAAKGRLWVVCRKCERWNLTPLESRWEAIEACEALYRETRLRVATDNIGLARLTEGLELVRIGEPLRPEFAAWRYGDQFGRRRRRSMLIAGGVIVAVGGIVTAGAAAGVSIGAFGSVWGNIPNIINATRFVRLRAPDGRDIKVRGNALRGARLLLGAGGEPELTIKHQGHIEVFRGQAALDVAGRLLPTINPSGGNKAAVAEAVSAIESQQGPAAFLERYLRRGLGRTGRFAPDQRAISSADKSTQLALEMALHEEAERRAVEGELAVLEAAWIEAEETAHIADNLFVSPEVDRRLEQLKSGTRPEGE